MKKKGSFLWVILIKKGSILGVIFNTKRFNSWSHIFVKKFFESLKKKVLFFESHSKGSIIWVIVEENSFSSLSYIEKVQFVESYSKKKNWVIFKGSILRVTIKKKKVQFCWVTFAKSSVLRVLKKIQFFKSRKKKGFNLLSRIQQKKEFNSSSLIRKRSSILWVIFRKRGSILWVIFKKKGSILWVIFWRKFISWSQIWKKGQFFPSYLNKRSNSFRHIWTKGPILCVILQKFNCSILWVMFKKGSNIWVIFPKKVNSLGHIKEGFNSSKHIEKIKSFESYWKSSIEKCSILRVICWEGFSSLSNILKMVQFFESNWKEGFHSVSHINRKGSIPWIIVFQKKFNSWVIFLKRVKSLESFLQKNFLNHIEKRLNWVAFNE